MKNMICFKNTNIKESINIKTKLKIMMINLTVIIWLLYTNAIIMIQLVDDFEYFVSPLLSFINDSTIVRLWVFIGNKRTRLHNFCKMDWTIDRLLSSILPAHVAKIFWTYFVCATTTSFLPIGRCMWAHNTYIMFPTTIISFLKRFCLFRTHQHKVDFGGLTDLMWRTRIISNF